MSVFWKPALPVRFHCCSVFSNQELSTDKKLFRFQSKVMENVVFWDVAPCRSCVNRRFGGTYRLHLQGRKIRERGTSVSRWPQAVATTKFGRWDGGFSCRRTAFSSVWLHMSCMAHEVALERFLSGILQLSTANYDSAIAVYSPISARWGVRYSRTDATSSYPWCFN
jgi:hypothetical protein